MPDRQDIYGRQATLPRDAQVSSSQREQENWEVRARKGKERGIRREAVVESEGRGWGRGERS
jgi:hypothetical protein